MTDCAPNERGKEKLNQIASCYASSDTELKTCREQAIDAGLVPQFQGDERDIFFPAIENDLGLNPAECVVKYDKKPLASEWLSNYKEANNWESFTEEQQKLFFPVHAHGNDYRWLTMPRSEERKEIGPAQQAIINQRLKNRGLECDDIHHKNIGRLDGELRIFDYGEDCRQIE